jgi:cytochrome P450
VLTVSRRHVSRRVSCTRGHTCRAPQGPRNCLGQHLALLEARVVLALLTQRFEFKAASAAAGERHPTVIPVASLEGMPCTLE